MTSGVGRVLDASGNIDEHCFQIGDMAAGLAYEPPAGPTAPQAPPAANPTKPLGKSDALTTRQLLAQLRARLRVVDREIKERKTLEQERDQLRRLIGAAKQERDNVRRIRSAG